MKTAMKRALAIAAGGAIALSPILMSAAASAAAHDVTIYVSTSGADAPGHGTSCSNGYATIDYAIGQAGTGDRVIVCKGTYYQTATVGRTLTLKGLRGAVIDATGLDHGIDVTAEGVTVRGFTVEHASLSGILVMGSHATIIANISENNLTGIRLTGDTQGSYVARNTARGNGILGIEVNGGLDAHIVYNHVFGNAPGNIGAGMGVSGFRVYVEDNVVSGNNAGIGLGDSINGKTGYSLVSGNTVIANRLAGISLVGFAQTSTSNAVYHNVISHNIVRQNGISANYGAPGVVLSSEFFFDPNDSSSYVYDNTVTSNQISGNGGPGVAVHAYADASLGERQHMNGNVITGNHIRTNNLAGDGTVSSLPGAPSTLTVSKTTGILVASSTRLSIRVAGNFISHNHYGIWKNKRVRASGLRSNHYARLTVPVYTYTGG